MTPLVAIALITKLKLIFETDAEGNRQTDKFLAFQNGAFPVSKENFYFMDPVKYGLGTIDTALKMVDFANTFNFISSIDDFISPTSDELNEVYYEAVKNAVAANSTRTQQQEEQFEAAKDFLYKSVQTPDGQTITAVANYSNYEDQYKEALSEYKMRQLAVINAQGNDAAAIKAQWTTDEPQIKKAISIALLNWETIGNRGEVEKFLGQFMSLAGTSPAKTIADLKQDYELFTSSSALDHLANEIRYIPTYFTPSNFFDDNVSWPSMSLNKAEINTLVQKAPQRLKDLFDMNDQHVDINNVSFEYIVVDIVREWLHYKDFVLQRFWKQPPGQSSLSDGNGEGKLPAFPEKIIFVRNVKIETPPGTPTTHGLIWKLTTQLFQKLKPQVVNQLQQKNNTIERRKVNQPQLRVALQKDVVFSAKTIAEIKPAVATSALLRSAPSATSASTLSLSTTRSIHPAMLRSAFLKPATASFAVKSTHGITTVGTTVPAASTITEHKEMELLGFICLKVPLCADPDPQLKWDT